jgi:HEAT repeat protein
MVLSAQVVKLSRSDAQPMSRGIPPAANLIVGRTSLPVRKKLNSNHFAPTKRSGYIETIGTGLGMTEIETTDAVVAALADTSSRVQAAAANTLCAIGNPSTILVLTGLLLDPNGYVRSTAVAAICKLGRQVFGESEFDSQSPAFAALVTALLNTTDLTDDQPSERPLKRVQTESLQEQNIRSGIAEALSLFGQSGIAPLIAALHHEYDIVRLAGAVGLGMTGNAAAIPALSLCFSASLRMPIHGGVAVPRTP